MPGERLQFFEDVISDLKWTGAEMRGSCPHCGRATLRLAKLGQDEYEPSCPTCPAGEIRDAVRAEHIALRSPRNGAGPPRHPSERAGDWEEPVSLDVAALPAFPLDALPPYLGAMVTGTAHATQTPPDLAAMVSLAVLSAAVQKRAEAVVREGWREVLSLWTVTSLAPGNRKTHAYGPIVQPLIEYEIELVEQMKDEIAAARTEYEITEGALKKLKDTAVKAKNAFDREAGTREAVALAQKLERMPIPKSPRLIADDATPEELGRLLVSNGGRMAIVSDEGDVFDMMAGKYSSGKANIGVYLRGHSGGDIIVDRVGRADIVVRRAAIAFGLCVQPETLTGLTSNPTFKGRGLVGRFLYAMPSSRLGDREIRPAPLLSAVAAVYHDQMKRLLSLPAALDESGSPTPHLIPFSDAAEAAVADWERAIEPRLRPGADLGHMTDWAGKLVGQTCRIAALLHLAELAEIAEPWRFAVELDTFLAARRIAEYLIPHALCAFQSMGSDPVFTKARLILAWIKRAGQPQFAKRDAFNALRSQFPRAADLDEPLAALLEHGFLRQVVAEKRDGPGQPPSPSFLVYPDLLP
jgi:replicative DNA helicase